MCTQIVFQYLARHSPITMAQLLKVSSLELGECCNAFDTTGIRRYKPQNLVSFSVVHAGNLQNLKKKYAWKAHKDTRLQKGVRL